MAIKYLRGRWQLSSHYLTRHSKYLMIISCPRARTLSDKEKGTLKVIKVLFPFFYSGLTLAAPPGSHSSSSHEELPPYQLHCWMALNRVLPHTRGGFPETPCFWDAVRAQERPLIQARPQVAGLGQSAW